MHVPLGGLIQPYASAYKASYGNFLAPYLMHYIEAGKGTKASSLTGLQAAAAKMSPSK